MINLNNNKMKINLNNNKNHQILLSNVLLDNKEFTEIKKNNFYIVFILFYDMIFRMNSLI